MHGLINRSIQCFIRDSYGADVWQQACLSADLGFDNFEAMLIYDDVLTDRLLTALCKNLGRNRAGLMEDLGTYLVSHPNLEAVRRLLRFGGETFEEFLHSLDDLQGRVRLALPDLDFPNLTLRDRAGGVYALTFLWDKTGFAETALGALRAMADDYGALVLMNLESQQQDSGDHVVFTLELLDTKFTTGREFTLQAGA